MKHEVSKDLREEYSGTPLDLADVAASPFHQFARWFDEAVAAQVKLANGMTLATVGPDGRPSARVVLLKSYDEHGFVFYTSYQSRKAQELTVHPWASLLFWWAPLERQIRVEGCAARVSAAVSDEYFATRPRASNLSAMASPQSQTVSSRRWLEDRVAQLEREWQGRPLVRPDDWGGYRLEPERFEFWQGRPDRLHDRVCYQKVPDGQWRIERLAP